MKNKCVITVGPESSGSMLIARILAHALDISEYGDWSGIAWCDNGGHKICHRSLPFGVPPRYPDVDRWISNNQDDYDLYFVLTTRDISLSEYSRMDRFKKEKEQVEYESIRAHQIMSDILSRDVPSFIWSYETFMFLESLYLQRLYKFLSIESDFIPELSDANAGRLSK